MTLSFIGKPVQIIDDKDCKVRHPIEDRYLQNGDILLITHEDKNYFGFTGQGLSIFGSGILSVSRHRCVTAPEDRVHRRSAEIKERDLIAECRCPDLLRGHHHGCPYYKEL